MIKNRIINLVVENKSFTVFSLGCRTNAAEASLLAGWLESLDLKSDSKKPDLIFVNTCAVTKTGLDKSLKKIKILKGKYPQSKIIAFGCGIESNKSLFNVADLSLNNRNKEGLISTINNVHSRKINSFAQSGRFLLRIQSGCNHYCSYCIVPFLRKTPFQLNPKEAVDRVRKAAEIGYREVVLTGTNLGLYKYSLPDLINKFLKETTIARVGFGSINYEAFDKNLILLFKNEWRKEKIRLNRYLHIPLQSASDNILTKMNRSYSAKKFSNLLANLTEKNPLIKIGTDIIVGFPGETDDDFEITRKFILENPIHRLHVFRYSSRKNTLAEKESRKWGRVDENIAKKRAETLRKISKEKELQFKKSLIGKKLAVLFLKRINSSSWYGITDNYQVIAHKSKENLRGKIREIKIS
jgi:threonylcarbamoyladenosine tRNA methylthiotransferase MtaB